MENILKFLRMAFNIIVFFLGVSVLFMMSSRYNELVAASMENVSESYMLYEAEPIDINNFVTKAELTAILMDCLPYDIEVINPGGSFIIQADGYSPDHIGSYSLTGSNYSESYIYNMDGSISRIIFQYIS